MSFFNLFASSRALRLRDAGLDTIPETLRVHAQQQCSRTWTILTGTDATTSHQLTKLILETPGVILVRVRPDLARIEPDAVARVIASSDSAQTLERLHLAIKHKQELRLEFKNNRVLPTPSGMLLVEIELTRPELITDLKVSGGGDVVVEGASAFTRRDDAHVSIVAMDRSRVFVHDHSTDSGPLALRSLKVVSISGGEIFLSSTGLFITREQLVCLVLGNGRISLRASRIDTRELVISVVGDQGNVQVLAPDAGFSVGRAEAAVLGSGTILVQSSPMFEREAPVVCDQFKIEVAGPGCVDVAAIATRQATVSAKANSRVVVQPRERLVMTCEALSTVENIGPLPPQVDPAPAHIPPEMLLVLAHENRVWTASAPVPVAPTALTTFAMPRVLQLYKAGLRETMRPLGAIMQVFNPPVTNQRLARATPNRPTESATSAAWVNVMSDMDGGNKTVH